MMTCPHCGRSNTEGAARCAACGTRMAPDRDPPSATDLTDAPTELDRGKSPDGPTMTTGAFPSRPAAASAGSAVRIAPGTRLGNRYEILEILGEGGMGTVYKARDLELGRIVALKVIRPEMASRPEVVERFKREILLASQVTHKNVLRIHDLGEAGEVRFISMNYVEGSSLKAMLEREGPLSLEGALPLIRQVGEALQAAHEAGVVHRDLKPQNILIDTEGTAYIADFGISRSMDAGGTMTETGAILGTVDYMSPEQARGETPDHRGDIYSLGVILYEMFTGTLPFRSGNALSVMMRRIHEEAPTIRLTRPGLPVWLAAIVARALQRDPAARYQSARDLLRDLERQRASVAWRRLSRPRVLVPVGAVLAVIALAGATLALLRARPVVVSGPQTSLALLPFQNATGDPRYDWVRAGLPNLLRSDLLQAKSLRLVGDDRVQEVLTDLKAEEDLRPATIHRLAGLVSAESLLTGRLMKVADRFRIDATLLRAGASTTGPGTPIRVEGNGEGALFSMVDDLSSRVREELGVSRGLLERDRGTTELSTRSVEALKFYSEGLSLARAGNHLEAAKRLEAALEKDPQFAVARALLAETHDRLGHSDLARAEAEKAATGLSSVSPYEATRIRAVRARLSGDLESAEKAYRSLCEISPNSAEAFFELATVEEEMGDLQGALNSFRRVTALDPKHPSAHFALGRVQVKLGNPAEALKDMNTALGLHLETRNDEGRATALNGLGNAYRLMGQYDEALKRYSESLEIRRHIGDRRGVNVSLGNMAVIQRDQGQYDDAIRSAQEALKVSREIGNRVGLAEDYSNLGDIYEAAGRPQEALECYQESLKIVREVGDEVSLARNFGSIGYVQSTLGRYVEAFFFLKEALAKRRKIGDRDEIVRSLIEIGAVEQVQGRYDEALKYYLEGRSLAREIGGKMLMVVLSANLSNIHEDQGEYGSALGLLTEAEAMAKEMGDKRLIATCLSFLGSTLCHLGDHQGADVALVEASRLAREMDNTSILAEALTSQGDLLLAKGQTTGAIAVLNEAVATAEKAKDRKLLLEAKLQLGEARRSVRDLQAILQEARSSGLAPLVAPAHLALAQLHLATARSGESLRETESTIEAATPLLQRDLLFQAHHLAGKLLQRQGKAAGAADHFAAGLSSLEEMRQSLRSPYLDPFLRRQETASFLKDAEALFQQVSRPNELRRLQAISQP
jgi:eukaryotic-like serine/threonine-protein kinase